MATAKIYNRTIDDIKNTQVSNIPDNSSVLDVGCATGFLGEYLVNEKNCKVFGVDISEQSIKLASNRNCYERLFCIDLNNYNNELFGYTNFFDYIVMGDILEHLLNPELILSKFKSYLKKDGIIIVSLPNISHGSIKLNLLKNRFEYTENGLLDNTHIKFYTLKNIIDLMSRQNLEILNLKRVYVDIYSSEQNLNKFEFPFIIKNYVCSSPESYVYQYVITVKYSIDSKPYNNNKFLNFSKNDKYEFNNFKKSIRLPLKRRVIKPIEEFIKYYIKK